MKKNNSSIVPAMMIMAGMGVAAYMLYKKNPDMICDMKEKVKETAYKVADTLEEME